MIIKKEIVVIKTSRGITHGTITTHEIDNKKKMYIKYD